MPLCLCWLDCISLTCYISVAHTHMLHLVKYVYQSYQPLIQKNKNLVSHILETILLSTERAALHTQTRHDDLVSFYYGMFSIS